MPIRASNGSSILRRATHNNHRQTTNAPVVSDRALVADPAPISIHGARGRPNTVNLKFSENFATGAGQRKFNVLINGVQVLTNFDIFAAASGMFRAVDQAFAGVNAPAGLITIQFVPVAGAAKIDAIEIF